MLADLLDLVVIGAGAQPLEFLLPVVAVLLDPAVGPDALADVGEDAAHRLADVVVDDARPGGVVAELGGVGDRVAHVLQAALVHQVDDQLHLVQALEVGHLGLVAGLDQRLEAGGDQRADAAAEDRLLAEEVGLGLLGEGRLDDAGAGAAERLAVGKRILLRRAAGVAVDRQQARHADPFGEEFAQAVPGTLRRDHADIHAGGRVDLAEVDVEAVGEHQRLARPQVSGDRLVVDAALHLVRHDDHDRVGLGRGVGDAQHPQPLGLGLRAARAPLVQPHAHVDAAVAQVERVGVPLAAVADDRHALARQAPEVGVVVVVDRRRHPLLLVAPRPPNFGGSTAPQRLSAPGIGGSGGRSSQSARVSA